MVKIEITKRLIGSLSETYFKEYCDQTGWAYISLEQIHENKIEDNVLKFRKGFNRILVRFPEEIIKEVEDISNPLIIKQNPSYVYDSLIKQNPSYVYDFLICKVGQTTKDSGMLKKKNYKDLRWAEVKTGYSQLSKRQICTLEKITIPLYRYRVPHSLSKSDEVEIYYDRVDSKFLFEHGHDSKRYRISMKHGSVKNKTSFKKVTPEKFSEIKQRLKKLFKVTTHQSNDPNIAERFEIVKTGTKFPISYYKKGTLLIQGDESLVDFQLIIKFVEHTLKDDP